MSDRDEGPGAEWSLSDSTQLRILYAGRDEEELGSVATYAAREYDNITLVTNTDAQAALESLRRWPFDCLIVESTSPAADWMELVVHSECPVVVYTNKNPSLVDDDLLARVDKVVHRQAEGKRSLFAAVSIIAQMQDTSSQSRTESLKSLESDCQNPVGCFLVDSNGTVQWANTSLDALFGGDPDRVMPTSEAYFYRRFAANVTGGEEVATDFIELLAGETRRHGQIVDVPVDGTVQQFLHASYPIYGDEDLRFEVIRPITTVAERYAQFRTFRELVEEAVDGLFVLDEDGYIEYCNQSYAEMVGYGRDELVEQHISKLLADGDLERAQTVLEDLLHSDRASETLDVPIQTKDGGAVDTSYHFKPRDTQRDEYAGLIGVVRDVTERKQRMRTLERYRTLVEAAGDPMYVLDEDGYIQTLNEAMTTFTGLSRDELRGMNLEELFSADSIDRGREALIRVLSQDDRDWDSFEAWLTDAEDNDRFFEVTIGALSDDEGFVGSVGTLRDITERERRKEELNLVKQVFARSLRHNLRNEVSKITGYASLLEDELEGEQAEMVECIHDACESLAATSEKVSDLEWIVSADHDVVEHDLRTLVEESIEAVRDTNLAATIDVDLHDGVSVGGIVDLSYAIENLVENALEHGHDDGPPHVSVETSVGREWVTVTIEDDGPGLPRQEIQVLHEGKETALHHGSGLGLWLVDRVIRQSGGTLSFDIDDGTRAVVRLPRFRTSDVQR